jgi:hypothetical protein
VKPQFWSRLNAVQGKFAPENCLITVVQRSGESLEMTEARLQRWRGGEEDPGIRALPAKGEELVVILRNFSDQF